MARIENSFTADLGQTTMTSVTLQDIKLEYTPGVPVLRDINLVVNNGELLALLGPSGCGKTTLLRLIAGLLQPTDGDLLFNGRSVLDTPVEKREVAMVFQEHSLFPFMSVGENVAFGLKMRRTDQRSIQRKVAEALEAVHLSSFEEHHPDQLSGGQQQRVAIARAIVVHPKVLLLDEPLNNLEPTLREHMRELICSLQKNAGITTIFVTHDQTEAVAVADRIAFLQNGHLRQVGLPQSFFTHPADMEVARFFGGTNFIKGFKRGSMIQTGLGHLEIEQNDSPDGQVLATIRPEAIEIGPNGHNNLLAQISSYNYRGLIAQLGAQINEVELQIIAPPSPTFREGDRITIHIPKDSIFLLPDILNSGKEKEH
jgi:ABC-type Fe3+/spermidine/putrescine transport system ATPase subunit